MKIIMILAVVSGVVQPSLLSSCLIIKPYVALYGVEAVIEWAKKERGYTQAQINAIRKRCEI